MTISKYITLACILVLMACGEGSTYSVGMPELKPMPTPTRVEVCAELLQICRFNDDGDCRAEKVSAEVAEQQNLQFAAFACDDFI